MKKLVVLAAGLALLVAPLASHAQSARGNVYGTVKDDTGAALPGASVTLGGALGSRTTVSDERGQFRFLNVDHGAYTLGLTLSGFANLTREVTVLTGVNLTLDFTLKVAGVHEALTISGETPVVDTKRQGTATTITRDELSRIPSSRDPWALMRTIPGVTVDRVNVAGSESGQQSQFVSKGADPKDAVWSLDGVVITDMAALGASPSYFTYDTFDEVNFSTGGNNVAQATGGLGVNIVARRGTNSYHGSLGGYFTHDDLQSSNLPSELAGDARLRGNDKADHTEQIADWSIDLGGPLVKDKLWFYASYGRNDIRIKRLDQTRDKTLLKNTSAKLNWQASANDMVSLFWFVGAKEKIGRSGAFGAFQHLDGTLWNQGNEYTRHPHGLSKIEWNHVFSPSFYVNAKASYYSTGFNLLPQGGSESDKWVNDAVRQEGRGTADARVFERPQTALTVDASRFAAAFGGNHEIKFGAGFRDVDSRSDRVNPGQKVQARFNATSTRARFFRDASSLAQNRYLSFYVADTFTRNRLTLNLGLRFDRQTAQKLPGQILGNPVVPALLPALDYAGDSEPVSTWNDLSPRVGFTWALDDGRKTVVRASLARYAGQMSNGAATWNNPVATSFLEYDWRDLNGDEIVQLSEVDFRVLRASSNIDPNNPTALVSPKQIDPDYHSNKDNEVVLGIDRELAPSLAASVAYTWRKSTDLTASQLLSGSYWYSWVGITEADYRAGTPFTRNGFTATNFVLNPAALTRPGVTRGSILKNRPDYSRTFNGLELSLVKRMSHNWMGRLALSFNDWKENVGPGAIDGGNPSHTDLDPKIDGGQVAIRSAGSGKIFYQNAKWQVAANALYQLPADFEVAASVFGRQGYPNPIYATLDSGALDGFVRVLADGTQIDTQRFPALWDVDLRLAKSIKAGGTRLTLSAEVFNLFNSATELKRINDFSSTAYRRLDEILAPRILRVGARLSF